MTATAFPREGDYLLPPRARPTASAPASTPATAAASTCTPP
ncbi:hypothetical protein O1157_11195 [Streptomyces albogriseolus]